MCCHEVRQVLWVFNNQTEKYGQRMSEVFSQSKSAHSITEQLRCGREPLEATWSNPPPQAEPPRAGCSGLCPGGFEVFQGVRFHSLLGKAIHSSVYPHSKSVSLYSEGTTCVFSLCPLPLVLSLSTAEKDLAPFS